MKYYRTSILWQMIRRRGFFVYQIMNKMRMSRPTLNKYIDSPELMSGLQRKKLSWILGLELETMDEIVNNHKKLDAKRIIELLELIEPLTKEKALYHEDSN